mmetsp:Transcript_21646/g.36701  ORF Transcript_21646/g.36701 Transcript_21646/m.36701 type:complete len:96 (+) Transcript_21646:114-401(+)
MIRQYALCASAAYVTVAPLLAFAPWEREAIAEAQHSRDGPPSDKTGLSSHEPAEFVLTVGIASTVNAPARAGLTAHVADRQLLTTKAKDVKSNVV